MAALTAATGPPPPQPVDPVLQRWLSPLIELAKGLAPGPPADKLTRLVEDSVRAQVNNVVKLEPVRKAWADGRKNLWVHGLVYHVETGRLEDLNVTKGPPS